MSVRADAKTVRDKDGQDKRAPTEANSVNAGFKVTKLLTVMYVFDVFSGSPGQSGSSHLMF